MCFGWYQELLRETRVPDLAGAEAELVRMLDGGGMIVHVYRDTNRDSPELVGRHSRLRTFIDQDHLHARREEVGPAHEVERFLLDAQSLDSWSQARETGELLESRWSVVELWSTDVPSFYGKAVLECSRTLRSSPLSALLYGA
jgi:hypothetical protein